MVPHDRPADAELIAAARKGDVPGMEAAFNHGASVNARLQLPLLYQWMGWQTDYSEGYTPLHHAVVLGNKAATVLLLEKGADVNAQTTYGNTPLMFAASDANKDLIDLLLDKGADIKRTTSTGKSAADFAVKRNMNDKYQKIVDYLVQRGSAPPQGGK